MSDNTGDLYSSDFVAWAEQQAALIRTLDVPGLDAERIAEELEAAGEREIQQCRAHLRKVMTTLIRLSLETHLPAEKRGDMAEDVTIRVNDTLDVVQPTHLSRLDVDDIWRNAVREVSVSRSVELPHRCPLDLSWLLADDFKFETAIESVRAAAAGGGARE